MKKMGEFIIKEWIAGLGLIVLVFHRPSRIRRFGPYIFKAYQQVGK